MERDKALNLLHEYIKSENLQNHCKMVAHAMNSYAVHLGKEPDEVHKWWLTGLLHDLDWEKFPDEHPNKALNDILPEHDLSEDIMQAIRSHAPGRTGTEPESQLDRYLFACDELSGFMNAVALMRPNHFSDMKVKSVTKKLKDARFAANVSRDDINKGAELIRKDRSDHILFLINAFRTWQPV